MPESPAAHASLGSVKRDGILKDSLLSPQKRLGELAILRISRLIRLILSPQFLKTARELSSYTSFRGPPAHVANEHPFPSFPCPAKKSRQLKRELEPGSRLFHGA